MTLKSEQDGKIQCIAAGQIGMNAKWIKKANDMMASGSLHSNSTNGILYNETRLLNIKKPSIMDDKTYGDSCFVNMSEAVVICEKNYSCRAEYTFDKDIATQKQVKVLLKKGLSSVSFDYFLSFVCCYYLHWIISFALESSGQNKFVPDWHHFSALSEDNS